MVGIRHHEADIVSSNPGDEAPMIIYGFTPINRPTLGSPNIIGPTPAVDKGGGSFTPPKARKSNPLVRTPVRRQVEAANQLWTPPPTTRKESSRAARSKLNAEGDSPKPKRPRRDVFEATMNSTPDWVMVGNQAQPEVADEKLSEERDFKVSQSALSKLDAFRYQAKSSDQCQLASSLDVPGYQLLELNHPAGQSIEPMLTADAVTGVGSGLTASSDGARSSEISDENCQTPPAQAIGLEKSFVPSAQPGVSDAVNGTKRLTKRRRMSPQIGLGAIEDRSSIGASGLQGKAVASDEDSSGHALISEGFEEIIATESFIGQLDCTDVEDDVEEMNGQHSFTSMTHHCELEENDGEADATNVIEDTVSFQDQGHVAQFVSPLVPQPANEQEWYDPEDDFLLDDDDIHELMDLSSAQEVVEPSSSLHLSPSQSFRAETRKSPERTEGSKLNSERRDICILKNGVYVPVEAMTTMRALNSNSGAGQLLPHNRANMGRKLTITNTSETELNILDAEESFDLAEEDETELADLTAAISQDCGAALWNTATAPPTPPEATPAPSSALETARPTSVVSLSSSPPRLAPSSSSDRRLEPFVRPPFPKRVRDRSPIVEVTSSGVLRTCFRIGEALNAASLAFRTGTDVIIELFARVSASTREQAGYKQHIEFADLFHSERPPFLSGTYELWKDGGRWKEDSRRFLDEDGKGKMCRAVGRLKRDKDTKMWKMAVLNIWEATWDDVAWVKGVVCA